MEVVRSWQEDGVTVPKPFERHLKVVLAPDRRNVPEITFTYVYLHPHSRTDDHTHDRPELIIVLAGRGKLLCDRVETDFGPDMALWILKDERHQLVNTGDEMIKLATVFVPGYRAQDLLGGILAAAEAARGAGAARQPAAGADGTGF
jgi:quercetin dioxygenase-like cupin family protein